MPRSIKIEDEEAMKMQWDPKALGTALRSKRMAQGLSLTAMGRVLNVDRSTIHSWEAGNIPTATVRLVSWLLTDEVEGSSGQLWRLRAMAAEAALRDVASALGEYRSRVRGDLRATAARATAAARENGAAHVDR